MRSIKTLGLLGIGVIGAGWAARALHCGINVIATDNDPAMESWLQETVDYSGKFFCDLMEGISLPPKGKLIFTTKPENVAQEADFIQESVSENIEIKKIALEPIAKATPRDVIIASSTSGFLPSELQKNLKHPERFIVGHPFNPVYLCPLVEVVGGKVTSSEAVQVAKEFYESMGMQVLMVRKEVDAFIGNRLQEAMWREILHMLDRDQATTEELDDSIIYGPGLRWAIMGMNQLYMMAGGKGGAEKFMEKFGPTLELPWCNMDGPKLSKELLNKFVEGTNKQADGKSIRELEQIRDECLVAIQKVLTKHNVGSGKTLNKFQSRMKVNFSSGYKI